MSLSVQIGLLLALATAFTSIVGFLYKHRGAVESPAVELRRPVRTSLALFRSRWYTLGIVVATASWGLHVAALSLAPISLVQSVIAGGLVLLTVIADRAVRLRGDRAASGSGWRLTAAGPRLPGGHARRHRRLGAQRLRRARARASTSAGRPPPASGAAALSRSRPGLRRHPAGGVGGPALGGVRHRDQGAQRPDRRRRRRPCSSTRWRCVILLASLAGLAVSARSLQVGKAVPVIAVTSAAANITTIASGPIVFGEPMPDDPLGLALRLLAFALVIAAAALTPPPIRAAHADEPALAR